MILNLIMKKASQFAGLFYFADLLQLEEDIKRKLLHWVAINDIGVLLNNNQQKNACDISDIELLAAAGARDMLICNEQNAFDNLKQFRKKHPKEWIIGYFSYDLKNDTERLSSKHPDHINFPALCFFVPEKLFVVNNKNEIVVGENLIDEIQSQAVQEFPKPTRINLSQRVSKEDYLKTVEQLRQHIIEGDIYEINYCVEFFAEQVQANPLQIYEALNAHSPVPFSTFVKAGEHYLLCASPERFLKKKGEKLFSQPIKGTIKRGLNTAEDEQLKNELFNSEKERSENLMIVDLVRNDLARSSQTGSVHVDELFGIYTFPQVHQMISTVSSVIKNDIEVVDAIKNAFPMGSMTGAPKIRAMQLIEQYEQTKRGLYSGAVGYFSPDDDFDFNVVIRSIQYNAKTQYLNCEVGGAITYDSVPENEYEECLLKTKAIREVLGNT